MNQASSDRRASEIASVERPSIGYATSASVDYESSDRLVDTVEEAAEIQDRGDRHYHLLDPWLLAALPAVLTLLAVFVIPVLYLSVNSLHPSTGLAQVGDEFTFSNYVRFLSDPFYLGLMGRTFWLSAIVVSACVLLAYPVAYVLARTRSRWRGILIFLVVAPLLISVVIRNLGWLPILGDSGLVNSFLHMVGLINGPVHLVNNFTGIVIGLVHTLLPFMILLLTSVIQRIEPELEEAAINLGAGPAQTFWRVVLPLSGPGLLAGYLLVFTLTISAYTTPSMLGGNGVLVMSIFIAKEFRSVLDYAFGATAAVILVLAALGLTLLSLRDSARGQR